MEENKEAQEQNLTVVTDRRAASMARIDDQALTPTTDLLQLALHQKVDTEQLKALMDLQERALARKALAAYTEAMAGFRSECPLIRKNKTATGGVKNDYATLDSIVSTIGPILSKHGLSHSWRTVDQTDKLVTIACRVTHAMGHFEETKLSSAPDTGPGRNAIQAIGSAVTYLQRYTINQLLGLAAAKDDDGGATNKAQQREPGEPRRPEAQRDTKLDERIRKTAALFKRWGSSMDDLVRRFEGVVAESWTEEQWATVKRWNTELKEAATSERAALLVKYKLAPEREPGQEG